MIAYVAVAVAVAVALAATNRHADDQLRESQRAACERGNIQRGVLGDFLRSAETASRKRAAAAMTPELRRANTAAARAYRGYYARLVEAASADPVEPGGVEFRCDG